MAHQDENLPSFIEEQVRKLIHDLRRGMRINYINGEGAVVQSILQQIELEDLDG